MYGTIIRPSAGGEEATLPGAEGDGLDGSGVGPLVLLTTFSNEYGAILTRNDGCRLTKVGGYGWKRMIELKRVSKRIAG